MATKTLQTRIQSKIATLAEWKLVESTFKPLKGEICIAEIPSGDSTATSAPTCLIKIGTGTDFFKDLTWLSARAADVQNFLKVDSEGNAWTQSTFEAWIKSLVTIDDVDTSAFATVTALNEVKGTADKNKTDLAELTTKVNGIESTHAKDKTALEGAIATAKAAGDNAQSDLNAYKTSNDAAVAQTLTDAKAYTDALRDGAVATNAENIGKNTTAIATLRTDIQNGTDIDSFADVETALAGKQVAGDYATKSEAQGYANAKDEAIADAKKAGTDAASAVTALQNGAVATNTSDIAELQTAVNGLGGTYETKTDAAQKLTDAKDYTDELANGQVKANKEAIDTLNGDATVEGSVDKKVTDAINDFATKVTGDNTTYDTFKELVDYVANHGGEAAEMAAAIDALETKMGGENAKSVATQISEAIAAENLSQYATDGELSALSGTVSDMDAAYKLADTNIGTRIDGVAARVGTLETEMDSAEGRLDDLEAHVKDVETNAEKNIIETVKVNGVALTPDADRAVDVTVPTGALASKDKVAESDLATELATKINGKVDTATFNPVSEQVAEHATKIDDLEKVGSEKNVIVEVQLNGTKVTPDANRVVNIELGDLAGKDVVAEGDLEANLKAKIHTHSNKEELDKIASGDKAKWDEAATQASSLTERFGTTDDVLIFNCGSSTVNV